MSRLVEAPRNAKHTVASFWKAGTFIAGMTLLGGCEPQAPSAPQELFLVINSDNGEPIIVTEPVPAKIEFLVPQRPLEGNTANGKIIFRRKAKYEGLDDVEFFLPEEVKAKYGTRVWGGKFVGVWGEKSTTYKGQQIIGGVWFILSDKEGHFVSPLGTRLLPGEKPYYVPANSVAVVTEEDEAYFTPEDLALLNASFYYKGTVSISKGVNIRTKPKLEQNYIPWGTIISINGKNIQKVGLFTILNPLATDQGDNPTHDESFSIWIVVLAQIEGRASPTPLYVNMSRETRDVVVADKALTTIAPSDFVPIQPYGELLPRDIGVIKSK